MSHGCAPDASWLSGSRLIGSSEKNTQLRGSKRGDDGDEQASSHENRQVPACCPEDEGKKMQSWSGSSERRLGGEDEGESLVALRELDAQRGCHRTVHAEADPVVVLEAAQVEI